jgi:23S rRNA pseudouridine1911/1915/1917 synthase
MARLERQALHAHLLGFDHPATRRFLEFRSELPGDLSRLHHGLRQTALQGAPGTC